MAVRSGSEEAEWNDRESSRQPEILTERAQPWYAGGQYIGQGLADVCRLGQQ